MLENILVRLLMLWLITLCDFANWQVQQMCPQDHSIHTCCLCNQLGYEICNHNIHTFCLLGQSSRYLTVPGREFIDDAKQIQDTVIANTINGLSSRRFEQEGLVD